MNQSLLKPFTFDFGTPDATSAAMNTPFNYSQQLDNGFSLDFGSNPLLELSNVSPSVSPAKSSGFSMSDFLSGQGGANLVGGIQGLGGIANALAAYKQYKLGKDQLRLNREAFNLNFGNEVKLANAQIKDFAYRDAAEKGLTGEALTNAAEAQYNERKLNSRTL